MSFATGSLPVTFSLPRDTKIQPFVPSNLMPFVNSPLTIILTYNYAPPGRSGEALGMRLTVNKLTQIAVPLVFGAMGSAYGLFPVFWANGAFLLAGGFISLAERKFAAVRDAAAALAENQEEDT